MPVRIADYRAIVMTYAQAPRLIFAHVAASNIHPRNLLARLSAFCARALILPALDHAKDATFASHADKNLKRSDKSFMGTPSPSCRRHPLSPANTSKPGPNRLNKAGALPFLQARTIISAATSSLQDALAKSREEAAAAKAEAQAARAEAAAPREHIVKLEAQINTLATGHAIPATPSPTTSQPPAHNPLTPSSISFTPSHVNAASSSDSLELDIDTQLPRHTNRDTTPRPSTHSSLADIPTLLESFTARFEAKLQGGITSINQECTTLEDAVIRVTTDNAALNHAFDALAQSLTDRYNNIESQLNLFATRLSKRDLTPSERKKHKATEGQDNPLPDVADDS
ncbi:hypothetical protein HPB51_018643 [Rhipicephalus microplus]|uniref:Uncharacterized protein n=1 Tax=Rhipicephalus microplus TaxID=6941 RepID=A0A9J6F5I0_RHIMP|nr:hypothetical protein HPB51_018643 [Rhipicephalus microplus]